MHAKSTVVNAVLVLCYGLALLPTSSTYRVMAFSLVFSLQQFCISVISVSANDIISE